MDLIKLQYFVTVAQYLNFTRAAEALFITQPTLSRQIAHLEDDVGSQLFSRHRSKIQLTPAGEVLLSEAKGILEQTESLALRMKRLGNDVKSVIKVGYSGILEISFLVDLLRSINQTHPEVDVSLHRHNLGTLTEKVNDGELDVIFTLESGLEKMSNLTWRPLFENHLQLVVSDQHPLAQRTSIRLEELTTEPFLALKRNESFLSQDYINILCRENDFHPNIIQFVENPQTLLLLVGAGKGVALLATCAMQQASYKVEYINLEIPDSSKSMNFVVVWRKDSKNPCIPGFIKAAQKTVQQLNDCK